MIARKNLSLLIIILTCLPLSSFFAQNDIGEKLEKHQQAYPIDKIYISHNQPYYAPGDTMYGKVFLVNGQTHTAFEGTPIVYVNLINPENEITDTLILKIKDDRANFSLPLSATLSEGNYLLRAYTLYQKNFDPAFIFQKEIKLIGQKPLAEKVKNGNKNDIHLQFFPEGGDLVVGLSSRVAFEATNGKGEPLNVEGVIIDERKEVITKIETVHEGMGIFVLEPQKGKKYSAKIKQNGVTRHFDLPKILPAGYRLMANIRSEKDILIQLKSSKRKDLAGCTLIGHIRGQLFLNKKISKGNEFNLKIERAKIPSGVVHFTLFNQENKPVCERLVFNKNPLEEIPISINLEKAAFEKRSLVKAVVKSDKSHFSNVSVKVYNKSIFPNAEQHNLLNYLWLQSDLKGKIRNINQYFEKDDVKTRTTLDYVLMTHGWRRFNWKDVLEEKTTPIAFPKEEQLSFSGQITKLHPKKTPVKAAVMLNVLDDENMSIVDFTTDESGKFQFTGYDFERPTKVFFQANRYNAKKKAVQKEGEYKRYGNQYVDIHLLDESSLEVNPNYSLKGILHHKKEQKLFAKEVERIRKVDTIFNPEWTITFDEVDVKARRLDSRLKLEKKIRERLKWNSLFYIESSTKIYMDSVPGITNHIDIYSLIRARIPGVEIVQHRDGKRVVFTRHNKSLQGGRSFAIFEVDGFIMHPEFVNTIPLDQIEIIDVKRRTSELVVYGTKGRSGVITIVTKNALSRARKTFGVLNILHPGYHQARQFYVPNYATTDKNQEKPDYRTCLYWNPDLKSEDNQLNFEFYTGDKYGKFLIFIEGINEAGIPFVGKKELVVGAIK